MAITIVERRELDKFYKMWQPKYGGQKEDYFAIMYLMKKFGGTIESLCNNVAFGNNDYGLDAYYIDKDARNLYLYQFKWSDNHQLFKESLERLNNAGIQKIFGNTYQDPQINEFVINLKNDLYEHQNIIDKIYIQFVFKGDAEAADNSATLSYHREELENKKHIIESYFKDKKINLVFDFLSDKRVSPPPPPKDFFDIKFPESLTHELLSSNKKMYVGFLSASELESIYRGLGLKFLNRNIRAALPDDNMPNRKIRETLNAIVLKKEIDPNEFTFIHNGITLAAESIEICDGVAKIYVPRLLNGAQTIKSINKFIEDNRENSLFEKSILKQIKLLSRIVIDSVSSDFVTKVTICNNRQNPVEPWHLRANDKIQCELQDKFKDELGIYYSRQENAFENMTDSDLEELGIQSSKDIEMRVLARTFLAVQGEIDKMSRLVDVFETQKTYDETFRETYLNADSRKIIIAYKTLQVINSPLARMKEYAPKHFLELIPKCKNLTIALLIQGLFNHSSLNNYLEYWGNSLSKEADFRDFLSTMAKNKISYVIREVLHYEDYQKNLEKNKYSFLRSKEIFRRCMQVANDWYGWEKKSV